MKKRIALALAVTLALTMLASALADGEVKLPKFQYKANNYVAYLDKELYIEMKVVSGGSLPADAVIELRDEQGNVWMTKAFQGKAKNVGFRLTPTEAHLGGHMLNLWYGDEKITQEDLRVFISDRGQKPIKKVETEQPYMAITLDCGFYGDNTDMVLKLLDEYGIKCTFFFTGYFVRFFPEEAARIRDAGHEIGNHTMWHPALTKENRAKQISEILHASEYIQEELGVVPRLFRPPYGDIDSTVTAIARAGGMEAIMWTIDSHDWDAKYTADKVYKRVTKNITPGTIILFHLDGHTCEENLRRALDYYIKELGLQVVPVTKLMEIGGLELPACPYLTEEGAEEPAAAA